MKKLTYGMVGGSMQAMIGEVHRRAIALDMRAVLVSGCFSTDEKRNKETAEIHAVDRLYSNYKEMAKAEGAREDKIDFVSIVTPNYLHYEMSKAFLEEGINVVCDKPLCITVEEGEELAAIAEEKGLIFAVTHTYAGYTMVKVAKEMIANGDIGEILSVNVEYVQEWMLKELSREDAGEINPNIWRTDPALSGGVNCVGDIGTHVAHMASYLTGLKTKRLLAVVNKFGRALEMDANIIVEYENGAHGGYWCTQVAAGHLNGLTARIQGTKGSLVWEQHYPDYLKYTPAGEATKLLSRGCDYLSGDAASTSRIASGHPEGLYVGFANIYRNVISTIYAIKEGRTPTKAELDFPTVHDGVEGMRFIHAVQKSIAKDSAFVEM